MKITSAAKYLLFVTVIIFAATPLYAREPVSSLLTELSSPHAVRADFSAHLASAPGEDDSDAHPALLSLEELRSPIRDAEMAIFPDPLLPSSDIPLTLNSKVEYFINYFQTTGKTVFSRWLSRSARYIPMMREILKREGMPEDLVYLAMIESGFQMHARSWASAVGPWQFISGTGKRYSLRIDPWVDERKSPVKATTAAALYLKDLHGMFNGNWYLAAAGYNAGENKILRAMEMYNSNDFWELTNGSYLKRETKEYVPKLLAAAIIAKEPLRYGFSDIAYLTPIEFDTVTIPSRTDLDLVARLTGSSYEELRTLNPDLRHWCTPPDYPDYQLNIPKGTKHLFEEGYPKIAEGERYTERVLYKRYRVGKKESLNSIAKRFGTTPASLADINSLDRKKRIAGKLILVPVKQVAGLVNKSKSAASGGTRYYTVKSGDTLISLAKRFKVSTKLISAWNNLSIKSILKPGEKLIVARNENNDDDRKTLKSQG